MSDLVVGIDLGTTNSCAAIFQHNQIRILENREGGRVTPSFVYITENNSAIVGKIGKRMADMKPAHGIYEVKRLLGRKFSDGNVQKNISYLSFQVDEVDKHPIILNNNQLRTPEEFCTLILEKIRFDIDQKLGEIVDKAVITVPAYFNISQREATLKSANMAGFTVLKLLNEPTAAALSYFYQNNFNNKFHAMVYDLGGGTFDVAILYKNYSDIQIVGVDGDSHLGGHDFDNRLIDYVCKYLAETYNYYPKNDRINMKRLKSECEEAKFILSEAEETTINLMGFIPGFHKAAVPISRKIFEEITQDLIDKTINILGRCLKRSELETKDIKELILCGGSSRIPKVQEAITKFFGRSLNHFVNPDECVAEGAALQAAMLSKNATQYLQKIKITDALALSLGIGDFVNRMTFVIKRNTPLPVSEKISLCTVDENQPSTTLEIYEGERSDVRKNYCIGEFTIDDLTPAPPGACEIRLKMTIDQNGILTVTAKEKSTGYIKELKIGHARGRRSDQEISDLLSNAQINEEEDKIFSEFSEEKAFVIRFCIRAVYNFENKNLVERYSDIYERCREIQVAVEKMEVGDEEALKSCQNELNQICEPISQVYKFERMPTKASKGGWFPLKYIFNY